MIAIVGKHCIGRQALIDSAQVSLFQSDFYTVGCDGCGSFGLGKAALGTTAIGKLQIWISFTGVDCFKSLHIFDQHSSSRLSKPSRPRPSQHQIPSFYSSDYI